jgi:ABC-type transport system substrate-binding protein
MKKNFRDSAKAVYATTAKLDEAKSLLKEAGVSSGSFALTFRNDRAYDAAVAEYVKGVWEGLGFEVTLKALDTAAYEKALYAGDFDVIALDYQALSTNAYAALAPFAPAFSGSVVSVDTDSSGITPHVTGYESEAYTKLLEEVLSETERGARVKKLVEVEKLLAEDCPAIALTFYSNAYLASSELKGLDVSPYGYTLFTEAKLKGYEKKNEAFLAAREAAEQAEKKEK